MKILNSMTGEVETVHGDDAIDAAAEHYGSMLANFDDAAIEVYGDDDELLGVFGVKQSLEVFRIDKDNCALG